MLTPLGKIVRKLRIEYSVTMKDMADGIRLSVAFVSAVETGAKSPTKQFVEGVIEYFDLTPEQAEDVRNAAYESQVEYRIRLNKGSSEIRRSAAAALARSFDELPDDRLQELRDTILRSRS